MDTTSFGQFSEANPHTVFVNIQKIEEEVRRQLQSENVTEEQIQHEVDSQIVKTIVHEATHKAELHDTGNTSEAGPEQAEVEIDKILEPTFSNYKDYIKRMAFDKMPGGRADNKPDSDFNAEQLRIGTDHEMEHTKDRQIAKETAKDHLAEDEEYYIKLDTIEGSVDYKSIIREAYRPPKPPKNLDVLWDKVEAIEEKLGIHNQSEINVNTNDYEDYAGADVGDSGDNADF